MTRTILLADDSVTIQKVVELTFLDEDFRVVAVGNGGDAIERLGELRPDIVLADVHMPGADGYEVAAAARERLAGVPVLLLVGTFEVFDAARAAEVGATGHLKKPFDSQELLRRVKDLLAQAPAASAAPSDPVAPAPSPEAGPAPEFEPVAAEPEPEGDEGSSWSFEPVIEAAAPESRSEPAAEEPWQLEPMPDFESVEEPEEEVASPAEEPATPEAAEAPEAPAPFEPEEPAPSAPAATVPAALSDDDVDRIARRVIELAGERVVRDIAWEVVPDLAEVLLKARIRELEASVE